MVMTISRKLALSANDSVSYYVRYIPENFRLGPFKVRVNTHFFKQTHSTDRQSRHLISSEFVAKHMSIFSFKKAIPIFLFILNIQQHAFETKILPSFSRRHCEIVQHVFSCLFHTHNGGTSHSYQYSLLGTCDTWKNVRHTDKHADTDKHNHRHMEPNKKSNNEHKYMNVNCLDMGNLDSEKAV